MTSVIGTYLDDACCARLRAENTRSAVVRFRAFSSARSRGWSHRVPLAIVPCNSASAVAGSSAYWNNPRSLRSIMPCRTKRFEIDDLIPVAGAVENHGIGLCSLRVCASVRISVSSSSVPKPPGKTTNARASARNQSLRMKK